MRIEYLKPNEYWGVKLDWTTPIEWTGDKKIHLGREAHQEGLYRFERKYRRSWELTYIGIAYDQTIEERLNQHRNQLRDWRRHGELWISYAVPVIDGHHTVERYREVEHVLTYFLHPRENKRKKETVPKGRNKGRNCYYWIENKGAYGLLPPLIVYPVASIEY